MNDSDGDNSDSNYNVNANANNYYSNRYNNTLLILSIHHQVR